MTPSSASTAHTSNTDFYASHDKLYVATDCIIFGFDDGDLKLLIFKRRVEPDSGIWSLIGSFVKIDEDVDEAARRVLKEITGLEEIYMEQSKTYGKAERDPGHRCISVAHYALMRINDHDRELTQSHMVAMTYLTFQLYDLFVKLLLQLLLSLMLAQLD